MKSINEGWQRLNGNVGDRVIEANIRELLHNPPGKQSWCYIRVLAPLP
ncbi:hypothetical protein IQ268_14520 [Oculatella sp. LEGE 06141]|nr:hypothetical protein [Oculatella sp. LEGE 06141]MBE9179781.1 hypothetical protein [Oculatella sp. LEGE 06141]